MNPTVEDSSKGTMAVTYGLAAIEKVPVGEIWLAVIRTLVVCPGAITTAGVGNGFTYTPSISTTVRVWWATPKKSSLLSAALMTRSM